MRSVSSRSRTMPSISAALAAAAVLTALASPAEARRHGRHVRPGGGYNPPYRRHGRRREVRPDAARGERGRAPASGLDHEGHDPLPAVRADGEGPLRPRFRTDHLGSRRRAGAVEARPAPRPDHRRRRRDQGDRHEVGQRRGLRHRREHRRLRGALRRADDRQGPCAGHEPHALRQRLRPAGFRAGDHGPRPHRAGPCDPGPLPALLPLLPDPVLRLPRQDHRQPQPSPRQRRGRRRHQRPDTPAIPAST